jgi:hypothetical protein
MTGKLRAEDQPESRDIEGQGEDDVEGHNMLINTTVSRDLAAGRSREIERQMRDQQRAREARGQDQKRR